jgi:asparagine synthase (glutamine-hydrolysing)
VFASELKSILASGLVEPELDYEAIDAYLMLGFVPGPTTILAGVSKLQPGHILVVENEATRVEQYWRYPEPRVDSRTSEDEYADLLLSKLDESVRMQLMSDVPLGAMLSGGIDSSLIVALMATHMTEPVKTFSVGFAEAADQNELADARKVAERFGTDHTELELSLADSPIDLEELVWQLDEPLADLSALGFGALCELASRQVTVALSGQGADELFGGYRKHRAAAIAGRWERMPTFARAVGDWIIGSAAPARFRRAADALRARDPVERLMSMSGHIDPTLRSGLVNGPLAALDGEAASRAASAYLRGVELDPLSATLLLDAQLGLVDDMLHYFDRASMAHSLEVRVPFLEHEFVECSARVPTNLKVRGITTKYILRKMSQGLIPDEIISKKKIGFFNGAVANWFTAQADRSIASYLLQPEPRYAEVLDVTEVKRLINRNGAQSRESRLVLAILMLEIWLMTFVPRATRSSQRPGSVLVVK